MMDPTTTAHTVDTDTGYFHPTAGHHAKMCDGGALYTPREARARTHYSGEAILYANNYLSLVVTGTRSSVH